MRRRVCEGALSSVQRLTWKDGYDWRRPQKPAALFPFTLQSLCCYEWHIPYWCSWKPLWYASMTETAAICYLCCSSLSAGQSRPNIYQSTISLGMTIQRRLEEESPFLPAARIPEIATAAPPRTDPTSLKSTCAHRRFATIFYSLNTGILKLWAVILKKILAQDMDYWGAFPVHF